MGKLKKFVDSMNGKALKWTSWNWCWPGCWPATLKATRTLRAARILDSSVRPLATDAHAERIPCDIRRHILGTAKMEGNSIFFK